MIEDEVKDTQKVPVGQKAKSHSLVVKKASVEIPAHIIDEAISTICDIGFIWSGPVTPKEMEYAEQYELGQNPEYANFIEGDGSGIDMSSFITDEPSELPISDDIRKSSRLPCFGSNLPDLDRTQLDPSTLLDILNKKASFPGSFISIPETHAHNKVLKHCGLSDDEYLVLFTPSYKDAMMLVGESYPFVKGNYYMTILGEEEDYIKEFAIYKDSKVISAPDTWLDLRITGSQLSQNFRRRCKISPKGLFAYEANVNGTMHWVSEAQSFNWHVLLDASALVVGKDELHVGLHRPDFLVCCPDNIHSNPSRRITCLLVRKKSFDLQSFILG
ncbi:hypothetical protein TSUD_185040 [Trifolium subterraneum]|uniref:Aminotransferase class V domain-containing protein n=1 Tax=Trifolium subterraneum TaxID=3900 RepID=A0A2Z6NIA5_TRISU|nr:hypothetical protein TSUD_185040 [Trifolium subterraneum]